MRDAGDEARSAVAASGAELGRVQVQHGVDVEGAQAAAPPGLVGVAAVGDDLAEAKTFLTHLRDRGEDRFGAVRGGGGDDDAFGEAGDGAVVVEAPDPDDGVQFVAEVALLLARLAGLDAPGGIWVGGGGLLVLAAGP